MVKLFITDDGARYDYGAIYQDYGMILPVHSRESSCQAFQDYRDRADYLQGLDYLS